MLITCLDTSLIPDSWDLKIKHEFFRLRFELEGVQPPPNDDVTMVDLSGDDGDEDSQSHDLHRDTSSNTDHHTKKDVKLRKYGQ
jgi:hypothetical protein